MQKAGSHNEGQIEYLQAKPCDNITQGLQCRMVLDVDGFRTFEILIVCFVVDICVLVHDVKATAYSI